MCMRVMSSSYETEVRPRRVFPLDMGVMKEAFENQRLALLVGSSMCSELSFVVGIVVVLSFKAATESLFHRYKGD